MANKDAKSKPPKGAADKRKDDAAAEPQDAGRPAPADIVRAAAAQAIDAAGRVGVTSERALGLVDELAQAAAQVRVVIDELRPAGSEELRALRERVADLEERIERLEAADAGPSTA